MIPSINRCVVSGSFDDIRSHHVRFLEEAARQGPLTVKLWSDALIRAASGQEPKFPQEERSYILQSLRYIDRVELVNRLLDCGMPQDLSPQDFERWIVPEVEYTPGKQACSREQGLAYQVISEQHCQGYPVLAENPVPAGQKKVVVTGCYDWLHSGHVRFFEEAAQLGSLYVIVGHDANVRLLKGEGHPLFNQDVRRYMVQSVRYVHSALLTSGYGWMDAEAEIHSIRPDIYVVNEDGDKPEKRAFCEANGLSYVVLKRLPKEGLPKRESTHLRGF